MEQMPYRVDRETTVGQLIEMLKSAPADEVVYIAGMGFATGPDVHIERHYCSALDLVAVDTQDTMGRTKRAALIVHCMDMVGVVDSQEHNPEKPAERRLYLPDYME